MPADPKVIRGVAWREVFPWLIIFRCFGIASSLPVLFLATIGVLLTPAGWHVSEFAFGIREEATPAELTLLDANKSLTRYQDVPVTDQLFSESLSPIPNIFFDYFWPFRVLFSSEHGMLRYGYFFAGALWMVLLWAFIGGAITRIAVVKLGREERVGLKDAIAFSCRKYLAYVASPLLPIAFSFIFILPIALIGLLMLSDIGALIAAVLWFVVLIAAVIVAILAIGLMVGWPLMWAAISAEGSDSFDALSRSFAYTFQRPLHYLFYAAVAILFGGLSILFAHWFVDSVTSLTYFGASWGANITGEDRIGEIREQMKLADPEEALGRAAIVLRFWEKGLSLVVVGFSYGLFWVMVSAIYLLLRQNVDEAEFDEIFIEGEEPELGLPDLKLQEAPSKPQTEQE